MLANAKSKKNLLGDDIKEGAGGEGGAEQEEAGEKDGKSDGKSGSKAADSPGSTLQISTSDPVKKKEKSKPAWMLANEKRNKSASDLAGMDEDEDGEGAGGGKKRVGFTDGVEALEGSVASSDEEGDDEMSRPTTRKTQWTERHLNSLVETVHKAQAWETKLSAAINQQGRIFANSTRDLADKLKGGGGGGGGGDLVCRPVPQHNKPGEWTLSTGDGVKHNLLVCAACDQCIMIGAVNALGRTWHAECFTCRHCARPLAKGESFYSHVGGGNSAALAAGGRVTCCDEDVDVDSEGPVVRCHECHVELTCPRCFSCTKYINGEEAVSAAGNAFHLRCFGCASCGKALEERSVDGKKVVRYFQNEGQVYCEEDFKRLWSSKCAGCSFEIEEKAFNALGRLWHLECFCCAECSKPLAPAKIRENPANGAAADGGEEEFDEGECCEVDGTPYCQEHYDMLMRLEESALESDNDEEGEAEDGGGGGGTKASRRNRLSRQNSSYGVVWTPGEGGLGGDSDVPSTPTDGDVESDEDGAERASIGVRDALWDQGDGWREGGVVEEARGTLASWDAGWDDEEGSDGMNSDTSSEDEGEGDNVVRNTAANAGRGVAKITNAAVAGVAKGSREAAAGVAKGSREAAAGVVKGTQAAGGMVNQAISWARESQRRGRHRRKSVKTHFARPGGGEMTLAEVLAAQAAAEEKAAKEAVYEKVKAINDAVDKSEEEAVGWSFDTALTISPSRHPATTPPYDTPRRRAAPPQQPPPLKLMPTTTLPYQGGVKNLMRKFEKKKKDVSTDVPIKVPPSSATQATDGRATEAGPRSETVGLSMAARPSMTSEGSSMRRRSSVSGKDMFRESDDDRVSVVSWGMA